MSDVKNFLTRFPRIAKFVAFIFRRSQIDETIETILGDELDTVNKLQELADIHDSNADHDQALAEYYQGSAEANLAQSKKARTISEKLHKLVS